MSSPIVSNICPCCDQAILCTGFSLHWCLDAYAVTLNGSFHAYQGSESEARAYIANCTRRQENAGITVAGATEPDPWDDYYGGAYLTEDEIVQERAELLAAAAEHEAQQVEIAVALDRLRFLGAAQAAHVEPLVISLVETPAPITRRAA